MISIVMGYFNRISLVRHTLKTVSQTSHTDFEVVIVDDYSFEDHKLNSITDEFPQLNIRVVEMESVRNPRDYMNPSVVYNVGFRHARGEKIIIQNPECCHIGDILTYTQNNLTDSNYLSFHCFAADQISTYKLHTANEPFSLSGGWYNHLQHRPVGYHFCAAITKSNLEHVNGFDERYANGYCFDDDEFLYRIKLSGLDVQFVDNPWVVHQDHSTMPGRPVPNGSFEVNYSLFHHTTKIENISRAQKGIIQ